MRDNSPLLRYGKCLLGACLLVAATAAWPAPSPNEMFRQAWRQWIAATQLKSQQPPPSPAQFRQARQEAIDQMNQALADRTKNAIFLESLGYFHLRDYRCKESQKQFRKAIDRNSREPRLHYQIAQVLALEIPPDREKPKAKKQINKVIAAYRQAARLDPGNGLAQVQAASILFDLDLEKKALGFLDLAVAQPQFRLFLLPVPKDLDPDPEQAKTVWLTAQSPLWQDIYARCQNAARNCLRLGEQAENPELALAHYRRAMAIGERVAAMKPEMVDTCLVGLAIQEMAGELLETKLTELGRTEEATQVKQHLERIKAAQEIAEKQVAGVQGSRVTELQGSKGAGVDDWLTKQAQAVDQILAQLKQGK